MVRTTPIVIDNPGGKRLVVIPFEEYERLRLLAEDMADTKAYDLAKRRLAAGEDEMIPAAIAEQAVTHAEKMMQTENLVRKAILDGMDPKQAYLKYGKF